MDTIGSMSSDLPKKPTIREELAELDANTVAEFKAAATAVTKLYTLTGTKSKLLRTQGYLECLEDLIQFITFSSDAAEESHNSFNGHSRMGNGNEDVKFKPHECESISIENVINWALNKQHDLTLSSNDNSSTSSPSNSAPSTASYSPAATNNPSLVSNTTSTLSAANKPASDQSQDCTQRLSLRSLVAAQKSQSQAKSSQFTFVTPPLVSHNDSSNMDYNNNNNNSNSNQGLSSYYGSMFSYNKTPIGSDDKFKTPDALMNSNYDCAPANKSNSHNSSNVGSRPNRAKMMAAAFAAVNTNPNTKSHNGMKKSLDFGDESDSGESDFGVLDDLASKKRYRRDRRVNNKMGKKLTSNSNNGIKVENNHNMNNMEANNNNSLAIMNNDSHHILDSHRNFNHGYGRQKYMNGSSELSDDESNSRSDSDDLLHEPERIPMSAFYYDNSTIVEPKRQRFV